MNIKDFQKKRLEDAGDFPKVVLIDTVSYCNLKCSMCFHRNMIRKQGFMSWETFTKIIDEISEVDKSIRIWMVFFGEPLMRAKKKPTIFDMIKYAKDKGLTDVVVNSNACLMNEANTVKLIESGLDAIYIGIDAFSAETYSKLRVGGNYERTVNNIVRLLEIQKGLDKSNPEVFVQFVEMESNRSEKDAFIKFWHSKGAIVKIRPMVSWAGEVDAPNLVLGKEDRWPCHWAMQTMSITDTGDVVTCAVDLDGKYIAGNVNEKSMKEIWNDNLKKLRQMHLNKEFDKLPEICSNCKDWQAATSEYVEAQRTI